MVLSVGTSYVLQPKLPVESHLLRHSSTHCFGLPSGLPKRCHTKMSHRDNFIGRGMNHPRWLRIYTQAVTQIGLQDR
jgi:hypothetical protein